MRELAGLLALIGCLVAPAPPLSAALEVTFEPTAVVATGISPSQQAVVFGVAREPTAFSVRVVTRLELLADEDGDGKVRYEVEAGLVGASVWWVVDLATGEAAVGAPEGFEVRWVPAEDETLPSAWAPEPELAVAQRSRLEVLLVRSAGVGVWRESAVDGGRADSDASPDGVLRVPLLGLEPVEAPGEPLTSVQAGDLVFAIAPHTLEVLSFSPAVAP